MSEISLTSEDIPPSAQAEATQTMRRPFAEGAVLIVRSAVDSISGQFAEGEPVQLPVDPVRLARIASLYNDPQSQLTLLKLRLGNRSN